LIRSVRPVAGDHRHPDAAYARHLGPERGTGELPGTAIIVLSVHAQVEEAMELHAATVPAGDDNDAFLEAASLLLEREGLIVVSSCQVRPAHWPDR
jgi:hypothetical protein